LRQKANAFQIVEKQCHLHFVMGYPEIAQTLGAYWYYHSEGKDKYYIMGASKDYMQPAEFVIDCNLKKVISCVYSDGGLGRMDAGDVVGLLSGIQDRKDEVPHVWSW
jgi:hypothetical protein